MTQTPVSAVRLISGTEVLNDDWILIDRGLKDGDQLSLVLSDAPCGTFHYEDRTDPETLTDVRAEFSLAGDFTINTEEKILSTNRFLIEHYVRDPWEKGKVFEHFYRGKVQPEGSHWSRMPK